jgi:hypothetical protein
VDELVLPLVRGADLVAVEAPQRALDLIGDGMHDHRG